MPDNPDALARLSQALRPAHATRSAPTHDEVMARWLHLIDPTTRRLLTEFIGPSVASAIARAQAEMGEIHWALKPDVLMIIALMICLDNSPDEAAALDTFNRTGTTALYIRAMATKPMP